jgi:DNA-binding response OmpR family regulator
MPTATGQAIVLVVEDEPALRRVARLVLEREGYHVLLADRGEQALARLELGQAIDLVICDLGLPDVSGLDLYRQLRAAGYHGSFMISSGADLAATAVEPLPADALLLPKPWSVDELERAVRGALAGTEKDAPSPPTR